MTLSIHVCIFICPFNYASEMSCSIHFMLGGGAGEGINLIKPNK